MADTPPPVGLPPDVLPELGASLRGWKHLVDVRSRILPTNLQRANLIRRGALAMLTKPPKGKR